MPAYGQSLAVDARSSPADFERAAQVLAGDAGVVLFEGGVVLRAMRDVIRCEIIDDGHGARRCAEEFKVLVENAGRQLSASGLAPLLSPKPLAWAVVMHESHAGAVELWPHRQDDAPVPTQASVRLATLADVPSVAALVERYWTFEDIAGYDATRVARLLTALVQDEAAGRCWVAEVEGRLAGYLLASFVFSLEHGGTMAEIDEFFVVDAQRGNGIGAALLESATTALRAAGLVRIQLQLGEQNANGRRFYARHGYAPREGFQLWDRPLP